MEYKLVQWRRRISKAADSGDDGEGEPLAAARGSRSSRANLTLPISEGNCVARAPCMRVCVTVAVGRTRLATARHDKALLSHRRSC